MSSSQKNDNFFFTKIQFCRLLGDLHLPFPFIIPTTGCGKAEWHQLHVRFNVYLYDLRRLIRVWDIVSQ